MPEGMAGAASYAEWHRQSGSGVTDWMSGGLTGQRLAGRRFDYGRTIAHY
ncbi:hypothetical protein WJ0W_002729 [Paenibacillus melissococcoides]|uniref:Uncharacterized protein n=1 Tax=Paenibacillus melissococcoides TaxID=2912268 RepID=A0ABM9G1N8_9BACL|nr:hypothetical protein [Paenibacillus melissococcoides]GIO82074.1 hypothetical protein J6TS7_56840 [Paenibacillus dendritiformis]CAH8245494.1 hypothetical protein WJ0W_002729 [Paenibacillus melissococcoides]CAH8711111.1 hypothetical protein WDD9_002808 [Paenibacillus melissococcoides]CAH8711877.1 hypothetical protein HTL2_003109 [Paenibacillus melissococcoides]